MAAGPTPADVSVYARCNAVAGRGHLRRLAAEARALLRLNELGQAELSLLLTDDREIRALNRRFRRQDRATDVLSFPQIECEAPWQQPPPNLGGGVPAMLGDIAISVETAARQAQRAGIDLEQRLRLLLIHGFLHLLGYDHERSPTQARVMFKRERDLLASLQARPDARRHSLRRQARV